MLPPFQFYKDQGVSPAVAPDSAALRGIHSGEEQAFCALGMPAPGLVRIAWVLRENFSEPRFLPLLVRRKALKS